MNTRRWWSLKEGRAIGYEPRDDAEDHVEKILAADPEPDPSAVGGGTALLGGPYTAPEFDAEGRTG